MLRPILAALAVAVLLTASLIPDDAYARRGGGGGYRGGGGGGMHAGRVHGGGYRGGVRPSHPIAGRPGRPGYPLPVVPVVRAIPSRAEGTIADTDTVRRRWEPQRLVPRPMALTTTATMCTAIGSVPDSTLIDAKQAHADGGGVRSYRRRLAHEANWPDTVTRSRL